MFCSCFDRWMYEINLNLWRSVVLETTYQTKDHVLTLDSLQRLNMLPSCGLERYGKNMAFRAKPFGDVFNWKKS